VVTEAGVGVVVMGDMGTEAGDGVAVSRVFFYVF